MTSQIIKLQNNTWLKNQKIAGQCVAKVLRECSGLVESKTPNLSLLDIEQHAIKITKDMGCTSTFLGYRGFPGAICLSVNKQLVHGIPDGYVLKNGDKVSIDFGATYEGAIGDAAVTVIYGENDNKQLVNMLALCKEVLDKAIDAVQIGKRIGCIGNTISTLVGKSGFGLITKYGGHGLDLNIPHAAPFISNRSDVNSGVRIQPGLTIAIEPMLVQTINTSTSIAADKWTVETVTVCCHFEHTIFVAEDKVHIITQANNEN